MKILPGGALFILLAAAVLSAAFFVLYPGLAEPRLMVLPVFLVAVLVFEAVRTVRAARCIRFEWSGRYRLQIGRESPVAFRIANGGRSRAVLDVRLLPPLDWTGGEPKQRFSVGGNASAEAVFHYRPRKRGRVFLTEAAFRLFSPLRLLTVQVVRKMSVPAETLPDIDDLRRYILESRKNRLYRIGIRKNRYRGTGSEVESMREYERNQPASDIDWKVSTRLNTPVSRIFRMESSNTLLFLMDAGRHMVEEESGMTLFDHTLNAMLILSSIALNAGDSVNAAVFADGIKARIRNVSRPSDLKKLKEFCVPVEPEMTESDYSMLPAVAAQMTAKRSFVILFSDIADGVNYDALERLFGYLRGKHHVLFVSLKDANLKTDGEFRLAEQNAAVTAARSLFMQRQSCLNRLRRQRVDVIDALPSELTPQLINRYMEAKSRNRL